MWPPSWRDLSTVDLEDRGLVGGKAAALGRLLSRRLPVPPGFVVTHMERWVGQLRRLEAGALPAWTRRDPLVTWIARSSAPAEDGPAHSFAGQFDSTPDLSGQRELIAGVRRASRVSARARGYAAQRNLRLPRGPLPVLVQRQVRAQRSGVLFTVDPLGQQRRRFALDWCRDPGRAITDGGDEGRLLVFDPLSLDEVSVGDPVVARALPRLVVAAFRALEALGSSWPLDLEWLVDGRGKVWIVQARPVTTCRPLPPPEEEEARGDGWWRASGQPVSELGASLFGEAGRVDGHAQRFWHAAFQRRRLGPWLLGRRVKRRDRRRVEAAGPWRFLLAWCWRRRRKLAWTAGWWPLWAHCTGPGLQRAERWLSRETRQLSGAALAARVAKVLSFCSRARRVHAAMWYPVDLGKDLQDHARLFGPADLARGLGLPRLRRERDRATGEVVAALRAGRGGAHLAWGSLTEAERRRIRRHLARHPFALASREQVQDPASWRSFGQFIKSKLKKED